MTHLPGFAPHYSTAGHELLADDGNPEIENKVKVRVV